MVDDDTPAPINLIDTHDIDEIQIGEYAFRGDELRSVNPPAKGFSTWRIVYEQGDGPKILIGANVPVILTCREKPKPVVEEVEEEPSADE